MQPASSYDIFRMIDFTCTEWLFGTHDKTLKLKGQIEEIDVTILLTRFRWENEKKPTLIPNKLHVFPNNPKIIDLFKRYFVHLDMPYDSPEPPPTNRYVFPSQKRPYYAYTHLELIFHPDEASMRHPQEQTRQIHIYEPTSAPSLNDEACTIS